MASFNNRPRMDRCFGASVGQWNQGKTHVLGLGFEAVDLCCFVSLVEVGFTKFPIVSTVAKDIVNRDCEFVSNGGDGTLGASSCFESVEFVFEVRAFGLYGSPGQLDEQGLERMFANS